MAGSQTNRAEEFDNLMGGLPKELGNKVMYCLKKDSSDVHNNLAQCRELLACTQATSDSRFHEAADLRRNLRRVKKQAAEQGVKIKQLQQTHKSELEQAALDHKSTLSELEKDMWGKCVHISARLLRDVISSTMVAERLHARKLGADAMVYAFTRANACGTLSFSLLRALHSKLREDAAGNRQALNLFYKTWQQEHLTCRKGCCPIPKYHDWACQMHGQQLQDLEDASSSDSEGETESEAASVTGSE